MRSHSLASPEVARQPPNVLHGYTVDFDNFSTRARARDDANAAPRHTERFGKELDERNVCGAVHRWRQDSHLERVAVQTDDLAASGARLHVDGEPNRSAAFVDAKRPHGRRQKLFPSWTAIRPVAPNRSAQRDRKPTAVAGPRVRASLARQCTQDDSLEQPEYEVRDDRRDVDSAKQRDDPAQRREHPLREAVRPPHPFRVRGQADP
jgi:hypothetical protein